MDFFATGAFQQLYSELAEDNNLDFCYGNVDMCNFDTTVPSSIEYYDIINLDSNNNHNNNCNQYNNENLTQEEYGLYYDFDLSLSPPDLSDWEQRLLDNFIEIPELIEFLPERTPLCTDMCDDFLQESNNNLRLAAPTVTLQTVTEAAASTAAAPALPSPATKQQPPATSTPSSTCTESIGMQLSLNAAGERGYLCTFGNCEKLYAKPAHLKAHLRRHLGEKPYACNWPDCHWRFSRSDELARHRRSHSGVKPYKCDYCAKCFARSDHLTKHRKVHERRLLAASRSGKMLPDDVYAVRPGRKRKNQI
ncbi:Krueppel-like factor 9 [Drosophila tropicalis]|uniref:Krueppel-like factor 9 n=1 Tax=Drosophila tropicalis TaxID=46794 RepID=UPI0035ABCBB4